MSNHAHFVVVAHQRNRGLEVVECAATVTLGRKEYSRRCGGVFCITTGLAADGRR